MNLQHQLNREIAAVTGESVREIARIGFISLTSFPIERDPEDLIVNWDQLDLERNVSIFDQTSLLLEA